MNKRNIHGIAKSLHLEFLQLLLNSFVLSILRFFPNYVGMYFELFIRNGLFIRTDSKPFMDRYIHTYLHVHTLMQLAEIFNISVNHIIIFTFFYINRRKYWFRANFRFPISDFWWIYTFWDVKSEQDFTVSGKCLSVYLYLCVSVCVWQKFCDKCSSRTNEENFMKFYI